MDSSKNVPVIDAMALFSFAHEKHDEAMLQLKIALQSTGFLVLRNSVMKPVLAIDAYKSFFQSPQTIKDSVDMKHTLSNRGWGCAGAERVNSTLNPDYKEFFDSGIELDEDSPLKSVRYYQPNQWPAIPEFKTTLVNYFQTAHDTCMNLLVAIAQSLGHPPDQFFEDFTKPMSLLRGNFYPPRPATATDKDFGIAPHTDYGFLTLVSSDGVPGLEILDANGNWVAINPTEPGDCVVNFGEMLEMWSGGQAKATLHRVVGDKSMERTSCAYFFNPNYNMVLSPPALLANAQHEVSDPSDESALMKPATIVIAGEYLSKRYNETYIHITKAEAGKANTTTEPKIDSHISDHH